MFYVQLYSLGLSDVRAAGLMDPNAVVMRLPSSPHGHSQTVNIPSPTPS